jgi:hypothetical protein
MENTFHDKVIAVQSGLKAPKNQFNSFGKYKYRSLEDILEAVKPLLSKHGLSLTITDEIKETASGYLYTEARAILHSPEGSVESKAQAGIDPNKKGMDIAQSFGASSSYARKYCLNGLFLIDDTKDADATNTHEDTTKWLNEGTPEFTKAISFIKKGGSIDKVKQKFSLSKAVENKLVKAKS